LLALVQHDAESLPDIGQCLEMIALVAHHMGKLDDAPALQFFETVTDVRAGNVQRLTDFLGIQGLLRDVKQRMNLRHSAVDSPLRAHFTPMQDELLFEWT